MNIEELIGKTIINIEGGKGDGELLIFTKCEKQYKMFHDQDCCEDVCIEDICGDMEDLIGSPIISARENTNSDRPKKDDYDESFTWTFYDFSTSKGSVTIRWYGTSNGYYSEDVDFVELSTLN